MSRSIGRLAVLCVLFTLSCVDAFGRFARKNPDSCIETPTACGPRQTCNQQTALCENLVCSASWCLESPMPQGDSLHGSSGSGPADVWAVGVRGTILNFDGLAWSAGASGTLAALHEVYSADASHAWAVGDRGTFLRWDGASWSPLDSGTPLDLKSVWGTSASDVWAVGVDGLVLH